LNSGQDQNVKMP